MSTNHLLTSYMEKSKSRGKFAGRRAGLDAWSGMLGTIMDMNIAGEEDP